MKTLNSIIFSSLIALSIQANSSGGIAEFLQTVNSGSGSNSLGSQPFSFSQDSSTLYAGFTDRTLKIFKRNPGGQLTMSQVWQHTDNQNGFDGLDSIQSILISNEGRVYVASRGNDQTIAWFDRDQNGYLIAPSTPGTQILRQGVNGVSGIDTIRDMVISPDEKQILTMSSASSSSVSNLGIFNLDPISGSLSQVASLSVFGEASSNLVGANNIAISNDGSRVIVSMLQKIVVLNRDVSQGGSYGSLTLNRVINNNCSYLSGRVVFTENRDFFYISSANSIRRISINGPQTSCTFVYEASDWGNINLEVPFFRKIGSSNLLLISVLTGNSLDLITLNENTGLFQRINLFRHGQNGVEPLQSPRTAVVSPDLRSFVVPASPMNLPLFQLNLPPTGAEDPIFTNSFE